MEMSRTIVTSLSLACTCRVCRSNKRRAKREPVGWPTASERARENEWLFNLPPSCAVAVVVQPTGRERDATVGSNWQSRVLTARLAR